MAPTLTLVSSSPNPAVAGQTVTFTATVIPLWFGAPTGTVTFRIGGLTLTALVVGGRATVSTNAPEAGFHTVTALYSGDATFSPSTGTSLLLVLKTPTVTTVASSPDPSDLGQPVTFTATVTPGTPGASRTPTGSVTFVVSGGTTLSAPVVGGRATVTTSALSAGSHTVTATYSGSAAYLPSTGTDVHTVRNQLGTSTVLTSWPDPSTTGQLVTFFATVAPLAPGTGTPAGTVTFTFGDGTPPVTAPVRGGFATATHAYLSAVGSPFTATASYRGDGSFAASSGTDTQTVTRAASSTAVSSSPDPSVVGQPVVFTATVGPVAPGAGTPTGTVTFTFGDGTPPVTVPMTRGVATTSHTYTRAAGSPFVMTASYSGDRDFRPSSGTDTQTVGRASTTTTVSSAPDPSVVGQPVVFTATIGPVAPGAGTPTGTVTFTFGDGTPPVTVPMTRGVATTSHTYTRAADSPYPVTASYSGDGNFAASSATDTQTVTRAASSTAVSSSPDPSVVGQPVVFTATVGPVAPGAGAPSGSVTFDFGDGTAPVTAPVSAGVATVTHTYLSAADSPYPVTATYSGDGDFAPSTGSDTQRVGRASTTTVVSSSPDPSVVGQLVTITASVAAVPPGAGAPTGTVTFDFGDGTPPITAPVTGGGASASHRYSTTAGSPFAVTATYSGDGDFTASFGSDTQTVRRAPSVTVVRSFRDPSVVGQRVAVIARVVSLPLGAAKPTGTVTFDFGDGTAPVVARVVGVGWAGAVHTYRTTAGSPFAVTATYSGDRDFRPSSGADTHTVGRASTTAVVSSSPDPSVVGEPVVFTATVGPVAPGAGAPSGSVTFDFGDGTEPATAPVSAGVATVTHTYLSAADSPYPVTAAYSGDHDFNASAGTGTHTVSQASSTTTVTSSPDPSVVGEPVTFTADVAAVAPGAGTPSGTVTFDFGDGTASAVVPVTGGVATVSHAYASSSGSPYTVTTTYSGDRDFNASVSTGTHTVGQASSTTTVTSSPDPSVVGEPVAFTVDVAAVAPGAGVPSGMVTFDFGDGSSPLSAPVEAGVARVTHAYVSTSGSPYEVTATYDGDGDFAGSVGTDTQTVGQASSTTTVTSSPDPSVVGQSVTFIAEAAAVAPGAGAPSGTVTFDFGDGTAPAVVPLTSGVAATTHAYANASASPYAVTAVYSEDGDFTASSGTDTQTVSQAQSATTVTSPGPSVVGEPVAFTADVTAVPPGEGTPTGTVTFDFGDGSPTVTAPVEDGTATVTHAFTTTAGSPYAVTATYDGDARFRPSSGGDIHTVQQAATATSVTSSPDPTVVGEPVEFTAAVTTLAPGAGAPSGSVTFDFGDGTAPVSASVVDGTATVTHAFTTAAGSPYAVTATYGGDLDFLPSNGTDSHTVGRAPTTTALTTSPDPSTPGEPVTLTAQVAAVAPGASAPSGSVAFDFGDGTPAVAAPVADGLATVEHTYASETGSPFTVTASYSGDVDFMPSGDTQSHTVEADVAVTTTTVTSSPDPSEVGDAVAFTATVTAVPPASEEPVGTITFDFGDGTAPVEVPLVDGDATAVHTYATAIGSPYPVIATFNSAPVLAVRPLAAPESFSSSTGIDTQTVAPTASTTTVTSAPDPSVVGQLVTFTAIVAADEAGVGTPTGTVTFDLGDGTPPVTVPIDDGVATLTHAYTSAAANAYLVTAAYGGDPDFETSTGSDTHTVHPAATTTELSSTPDPSVVGQPVTFTARVSPDEEGAGTPSGTVTFDFGDGTPPVTVAASSGALQVTHTYTSASAGPYQATATYSGDDDFLTSVGTDAQTVGPAATTTEVSSAPDPSVVGQPVTFVARVRPVAPGVGAPDGTVTFDFGDGTPSVTVPIDGGAATVTHAYTSAAADGYLVTATYNADADFVTSAGTDTHSVRPAATVTEVTSSPDPSVVGQTVSFTATVSPIEPGSGAPTGTVTFDFGDGSTPVAAPVTDGKATASHPYTSAAGSPYTVTATYGGDGDFDASAGSDTHAVAPARSTTTVTSTPDPSVVGQPVVFTAKVTSVAPGAGVPTGSVTFDFGDGTPAVTVPVAGGVATGFHTYTSTAASPYTVTAAYSPDVDFEASAGTDVQTVVQAESTTTVTSSPDPSVAGEPVTFTATVTTVALGAGTPAGTVTFDFGDGTPPVTTPVTDGQATIEHAYAHADLTPYQVTAAYSGDADTTASAGTATHTVGRAATTTEVSSAPDPSVVGQAVTFTARVRPAGGGAGDPSGTVTFDFGDGTPEANAPVTGGVATVTHAYTAATSSAYQVTATYGGSGDFDTSAGSDTHTVAQAATTTTVMSSPDPSVVGQPVAFTATVTPVAPGAGAPTGTVTFDFGDGTPPATVPLTGATATLTHAYPTTASSPYTVTATYNGDVDFTSSAGTDSHVVGPAQTATELTSSPDPSVAGQAVVFTATVTPVAPGGGTPAGSVTFAFGDGTQPVTVPLDGTAATVTHAYRRAGTYTVRTLYSGDPDFATSRAVDTQTVARASSRMGVVTSPDPSVAGQSVSFTARIGVLKPGAAVPTGTVTFTFGDGTPPVTAPLTRGTVTVRHAYAGVAGSPYTVTAKYSGDQNVTPASATDTHTVRAGAAYTSTTVTSSPNPSVTGQPVTFTATVAPLPPAAGTPTGTISFDFGDGTPPIEVPLTSGAATVSHAYPDAAGSPYTVTAFYSGNAEFSSSAGTQTQTQTVSRAATTTAVTSAPDPSVVGQPVAFTATITPVAPGAGTPTGTVTFDFGDGTSPVLAPVSENGVAQATHTYSGVPGTPLTVHASYSGDASFDSSDGRDTQTVARASSATSVTSAPDPSVVGQPVAFTATVTPLPPGAGTPTGTVTFDFGDGATATAPVVDNKATATHTYTATPGTPRTVTAAYSGDANTAPSTGTETHSVAQAATATTVTSSPDPSVVGQQVTFTATVTPVTPGAGAPSGTVVFDFGDGTTQVTAPLSGGRATVSHTYTSTTGSPHTVTATYGGNADFAPSSGADTQTVNAAGTTTTVTSSPDPSVVGQQVTFTATVTPVAPGAGTPSGTVMFDFGDGTAPATAQLSGSTATVTHTFTTRSGSPYTVTATYGGSADFTPSSGTNTHAVGQAATATTVSSSSDSSAVGQQVTFTATVTPVAPGAGAPSGTVVFDFGDGTTPVTAPLSGGRATVSHTYTSTTGSPHTVTATYGGTTDFAASQGTGAQTVHRAPTSTTVTSSPDPSVVGQQVTFTATVAPFAPGAGAVAGTVAFDFGDGTAPVIAPLSGGTATVTHAFTTRSGSPFTVTATYGGNTDFAPSNGADTQILNAAGTTTTVTSSPDPSVVGQPVTFTATVAPVAPGAGTSTGTVTFTFGDGTAPATAQLSGGIATVTHAFTTRAGSPFTVTATYGGNTDFASSSGTDTQTVNQGSTTTTITSSPDPSVAGEQVTFTASVTPVSPAAGTPTGTVTFDYRGQPTTVTLANGRATLTTHPLSIGTHTVTATYSGSNDFTPSTGTDTHTVVPR
ncbi:Ig-like domain repeat protein [Streptomyces sp. C10]|uniref:Ig-like domain repeat protein n=1 Tax=Streptomyces sp. C10 TaxID=531941 RepID=UPI00397FE5A6